MDFKATLKWLRRGNHRLRVLKSLAQKTHMVRCLDCDSRSLSHRVSGDEVVASCQDCDASFSLRLLDQTSLLTSLGLETGSSKFANGRSAIMELIKREFAINESTKPRKYLLRVNWDQVGVFADWQEDHGLPRLDEELQEPLD